jgi:hypothetical protein
MSVLTFPYTLPIGERMMFRDLTRPFISMIASISKGWSGNKCTIILVPDIEMEVNYAYAGYLYNLNNGLSSVVNPVYKNFKSVISGTISAGDAFVLVKKHDFGPEANIKPQIMLHLNSFVSNKDGYREYLINSELGVARDAILDNRIPDATKIVKELLPFSYPLFITLIQREAVLLRKTAPMTTWFTSDQISKKE